MLAPDCTWTLCQAVALEQSVLWHSAITPRCSFPCRLSHRLLGSTHGRLLRLPLKPAILRCPFPHRLSHYLSDKKKAEKSVLEMAGKLTQQLQVHNE